MKKILALALFVLAIICGLFGPALHAEPAFKSLSVSQTVASHTFAAKTQTVTIVSDGSATCYFRLFNNRDTAGNATTSSSPLKQGESLTFDIGKSSTDTASDSESSATAYTSISAICSSGQTATWRIYSK